MQFRPYVLYDETDKVKYWYSEKLRRYVVDLVFEPGEILQLHSPEANTYIGE